MWFLSLRELRWRMFENRTNIFELMRKKGKAGQRKLHYGKLHNLYFSPDLISVIKSRIK